ncbi:MAG: ABC transporter ATP-binding protein, partial [Clostridia bacterium]|nr:ABC transporter ATP-binding protein [Clostridia bacterium]
MKKIFSYCKPYTVFVALTLVIKTIGTVMDLIIPYLLGFILDEVAPKCTKENLTPIFFFGALMVLCAAVAVFTNIWANRRISLFSKNVIETLRSDLFRKILSLSSTQTDAFTVPSLVSRMSSDTYAIHHMLNMAFRGGIRAPLLILGGIGITLMIEPALSLTLIVLLPLMSIVVTVISKRSIKLFRLKQKNVDRMVEKVRDTFTGIRVIKALSKVDYEKESFHSINRTLSRSEEVANFTTAISPPAITFLLNLGTTSVVAVGALLVQYGHSTPGQIISFMSYFSIILNSTLMLTRIFNLFSRGAASADRIREVL